jgi:anti-sigma-K factor RskA
MTQFNPIQTMSTETCLEIQAYVDGELDAPRRAAVERLCADDLTARRLLDGLAGVRGMLRANEPEHWVPDSREFYWSQIQRRIAATEREAHRPASRHSPLLGVLRWLVPAAGIATVAMIFAFQHNATPSGGTFAANNSAMEPNSSTVFRSDADGVTVHWIN